MSRSTLAGLAADLAEGRTTSRALAEACLARIADPAGQGANAFVSVDAAQVLASAEAADVQRRAGAAPTRFAGIPIAVKDLFDVRGEVTRAGSRVLSDQTPALHDAAAVARLREAGFVLVGRTNMTEFAYSGLGVNPHYGTPLSPWRRDEARVAGGSSSGSAVAVADGMAFAALGSDTGGSCRIPAAFCGIVGLKPTARRVPLTGAVPLATSLDSIGPLGASVACCASLDAILAGDRKTDGLPERPIGALRLAVPTTLVLDGLDPEVAEAFERALAALSHSGAAIERVTVPAFGRIAGLSAGGGLTAAESYAWHRDLIGRRQAEYDPRVSSRILRGAAMSAADYIDVLAGRASLVAEATEQLAPYDAILIPSVAILPPRLADLASDADYTRLNLLALRNATTINMMDGCAISIPLGGPGPLDGPGRLGRAGDPPIGLTVAGIAGADRAMLAVAAAIEATLAAPAAP